MKSFKTRIYPTAEQQKYLNEAFGMRRFAWNWAVSEYFAQQKKGVYMTTYSLQKKFNNEVAGTPGYEWTQNVNTMFRSSAFKDFGVAVQEWHANIKASKQSAVSVSADKGKPHYKKKGKCTESAKLFKKGPSDFKVLSAHHFSTVTTRSRKRMELKLSESIQFLKTADIKTCTFSRVGGKYYMSLTYEKANRIKPASDGTIGIDLGIKSSISCFDGSIFRKETLPFTLNAAQKHTERINRLLARTQKGSNRHQKLVERLQCSYEHEANIKKDFREKLTTELTQSYNFFKIDDFSFAGAKNLGCNRKLHDVSPYAFKTRLEEKAAIRKAVVQYLPKFTPSTKTCACCGNQKMMKLSDRVYECPTCGSKMDRDANSAVFAYNY